MRLWPDHFRARLVAVFAALAVANALAWTWALTAFAGQPIPLGAAVLAYTLGLRHALDADHIAAIDNVTRKLMREGKRPIAVGLFFALGHSAFVLLAAVAIAFAADPFTKKLAAYRDLGAVIGTSVSSLFLFAIALANMLVLGDIYRLFRKVRRGEPADDMSEDTLSRRRGPLSRFSQPLVALAGSSWQLFPIGILFALGFETVSEVGLYGVAAGQGHSNWSILVFPALFAAGMTLLDTLDGVLMLGAYGWAYRDPLRKLTYNLAITMMSVLVALAVGAIEAVGLLTDRFGSAGGVFRVIAGLNDSFTELGVIIIAVFVAGWLLSVLVFRASEARRATEEA